MAAMHSVVAADTRFEGDTAELNRAAEADIPFEEDTAEKNLPE